MENISSSKKTKVCFVKCCKQDVINIDPKITFILFNELIEKNINFEFVNEYTDSKTIKYWFYFNAKDTVKVREVLKKIKEDIKENEKIFNSN